MRTLLILAMLSPLMGWCQSVPCTPSPNVKIIPLVKSYCEIWERLVISWDQASQRREKAYYLLNQKFTPLKLEDAGLLTVEEKPFMWLAGPDGPWLTGLFIPGDSTYPSYIYFSTWEADTYPVLMHEVSHFQEWIAHPKNGGPWAEIGHGTSNDIFVIASNTLLTWFIPSTLRKVNRVISPIMQGCGVEERRQHALSR